jgi:hypothetical protein
LKVQGTQSYRGFDFPEGTDEHGRIFIGVAQAFFAVRSSSPVKGAKNWCLSRGGMEPNLRKVMNSEGVLAICFVDSIVVKESSSDATWLLD